MRFFKFCLASIAFFVLGFLTVDCFNVVDIKADILSAEIELWVKSGIQSDVFKKAIKALALPTALQRKDWKTFEGVHAIAACTICQILVKTTVTLRKRGTPSEKITKTIAELCTFLNLQTEEVCNGVVTLNAPIILKIIDSKDKVHARDVCGVILQSEQCSTVSDEFHWNITVDNSAPRKNSVSHSDKTKKIVQITDIHYDPNYEVNGNAGCSEPTCCRASQNSTNKNGKLAGYWGDYNNCDTPWHAFVDALNQVKKAHGDAEHIYFTGDIIDHGVWETTRESNTEILVKSYKLIRNTFPDKKVYPIIGNHEPHPLNVFAPHDIEDKELSIVWLYELLANTWIENGWLPESTRSTILTGGFYTVSPKKGFRIIALNNNVCYTYNWWILYNPKDQDDQLSWLMETLLQAEKDGEFVHILAHIPPGDNSCFVSWSREYRKIVNRFSHIISAQFNGHTHNDEFRVFYSPDNNSEIVNVAWNGGSITTYANLNPNYKVYDVNANDYVVEDYEMWIYNLDFANETPNRNPEWFKLYSFKEEYNLTDTTPSSLNNFLVQMSKNDTIIKQYHKNFVKRAEPGLKAGCNAKCLKTTFCSIVKSEVKNDKECKYFENLNNPFYQIINSTDIGISIEKVFPKKLGGKIFG
ncbi:sphingomyelin phosphodiesterase 1-like [Belonocnema kinseyi]|uniref:sphingomyelin phosphodiesterase 1-like n=1 Tax=Belonocnema kinseyi TaxID=2817044 RepID=UPI00143D667F|nr:sphingomyelin phosphodiesterase 1-like [Belonocnema kinseyi]